jgi:prepilin-type processing-associated H-X9-DG protein
VRISGVTDGLSNTILFGERSHFDPNHDSFAANLTPPSGQFLNPLGQVGWWANSGGRLAAGDVTLSAYARINYRVPAPFSEGADMVPPATDWNSYQYYYDRRICAFGSSHPGGAHFALADGSVRFIEDTISDLTLQRLCVRNDGQTVDAY